MNIVLMIASQAVVVVVILLWAISPIEISAILDFLTRVTTEVPPLLPKILTGP